MFRFVTPSQTVKVAFGHTTDLKNATINKGRTLPVRAITACRITFEGPSQGYADGHAFCSAADNFNKAVGRKVSLQRAILNGREKFPGIFTKEFRKTIWDHFHGV